MTRSTARHLRPSRTAFVAVAALAVVTLGSCSAVGNDAARVGDASLGADELTDWLDDVATAQPTSYLAPSGARSAAGARELLTRWISARIVEEVVVASGGEVTDADRAVAREQLDATGAYAGASEASLDRLAEYEAVLIALDRTVEFDEADAATLYAEGAEMSGAVCARAIVSQDPTVVDDALDRIADGEDFATVADEVNPAGNFGPGGAVVDETGAGCIALGAFTAGVAPAVNDAVLAAEIGLPTDVVDIGGAYATLLLRPFDEVADEAVAIMAGSAARSAGRQALQSSDDVEVASRFGRWDPEQMAVVAIG